MSEDSVSILVPLYGESGSVHRTLQAVHVAAEKIGSDWEILLLLRESPSLRASDLAFFTHLAGVTLLLTPNPGKFRALRYGVERAKGSNLVLCDGDVLPRESAIELIVTPIRRNEADVCLGKPVVSQRVSPTWIGRHLEMWAETAFDTWDAVRSSYPECRWAISGFLYAIRADLFPEDIPEPLIDDPSIGVHAMSLGARFAYIRKAEVEVKVAHTVLDWAHQKIRTRVGWRRFESRYPEKARDLIAVLRQAFVAARCDKAINTKTRGLWTAERLTRMCAFFLDHMGVWRNGTWAPVKSTKDWREQ